MKAFGRMDTKTNVIEINRKKHKGDKRELADTIKHELMHIKHPKASEKQVQKMAGNVSQAEKDKLVAKIRMKKLNYKTGAIKRKLKMNPTDNFEPGSLIRKSNELSKRDVAIRGLV